MSFTANQNKITAAFVEQFHDTFEILCQQKESRLLKTVVNRGKITGNTFTINDMGGLEMRDRTRFGNTEWDVPDAGTRRVTLRDFDLAVPVDKGDEHRLLASVQGPYMNACLYAYQRKVDEVIYNALLGEIPRVDSYNGKATNVTLPNTQIITTGGSGSIKDIIATAKGIFRANDCDEQDGETLYITYDSSMLTQILCDPTLTSGDYMSVKMLQEGHVVNWGGVTWVPYNKLLRSADGSYKRVAMYTGTAVHYGQGSSYEVDIGKRRDKNNTTQIYVDSSMAAGRANEQKVVEIQLPV